MRSRIRDLSPGRAARIAGIGYLVIFVLAIFANFLVIEELVDPGNDAATVSAIASSEGLFRAGVVAFLIVFVVDVVIAWALYVVFRSVSRELSLLTSWFRLVYTVLLGVALVGLFLVLQLIGSDVTGAGPSDAQVALFLDMFNVGWLIGLACFGVHLGLLGYLSLRSGFIPRILGILLMVAGGAYVIDTLATALIGNYEAYATLFLLIVAVSSVIGELGFTIWLLARGHTADQGIGRAQTGSIRSSVGAAR